ncbi:MAG: lytic transglycosylase domain-containing protein [Candidatus Woesearchaeota archaeon]
MYKGALSSDNLTGKDLKHFYKSRPSKKNSYKQIKRKIEKIIPLGSIVFSALLGIASASHYFNSQNNTKLEKNNTAYYSINNYKKKNNAHFKKPQEGYVTEEYNIISTNNNPTINDSINYPPPYYSSSEQIPAYKTNKIDGREKNQGLEDVIAQNRNPKNTSDSDLEKKIKKISPSSPENRGIVNRLDKTSKYDNYISAASTIHNIDRHLIYAVIAIESGGNPYAISPTGDAGLMQISPITAKELKIPLAARTNPESVIKATGYLSKLINNYGLELGIAAYNCGPTRVARLVKLYGKDYSKIEPHLPKTTQQYVKKVISTMELAKKSNY